MGAVFSLPVGMKVKHDAKRADTEDLYRLIMTLPADDRDLVQRSAIVRK